MDGGGGLDASSSVEEDGEEVVIGVAAAGPDFLDDNGVGAASGAFVGVAFLAASGALAGVGAFDAFGDSAGASAALRVMTARMQKRIAAVTRDIFIGWMW